MYQLKSGAVLTFLLLSVVFVDQAIAQYAGAPFSVDAISVKNGSNGSESRLDLYTSLPHSTLRFLKEGEFFTANYELTADIFYFEDGNKKPQLVEKETWEETVQVADFAATQSSSLFSFSSQSFELPSGQYRIELTIKDKATLEVYKTEHLKELKAFDGDVSVSDLILVDDYSLVSQSITPKVRSHVYNDEASFKVFYELYAAQPSDINVRFQLIRTPNSRGLPVLRWISRLWQSSDEVQGEISYENNRLVRVDSERAPRLVEIPIEGFEVGEYLLRAIVLDADGNQIDIAKLSVTLERSDRAEFEGRDIDAAIAQLRYIAKPKELREIRSAKSKKEREERFFAFWQKRDPTPGTLENEHMQEYYLRIDFANRHYTGSDIGWETDRGHTLVLYGEPDDVDRSDLEVELAQPYEVWYYHRIGRRFIFVDRSGIGHFELITPTWSERKVIR